jgi:hypothetical protein
MPKDAGMPEMQIQKISPRSLARIAGALYVIVIFAGMWAEMFVRGGVMVHDNAAATATNILAHEQMFRLGFITDLIGGACYIAIVLILYFVLRPGGHLLALLATFFGMVGNAVFAMNLLNHLAAIIILKNAHALAAFTPAQLQALSFWFLKLHGEGYVMAMFFFGLFMATTGVVIARSAILPRLLGVLLIVGGLLDAGGSILVFLGPSVTALLPFDPISLGGLSEIALALWLVSFGANTDRWNELRLAPL